MSANIIVPMDSDGQTETSNLYSQIHIAGALMKTLESILPHAAQNVEGESLKLSETIQALLAQVGQQQSIIDDLIALFSQVEINGKKVSLDEFLSFLHCTLAFSLEKNLMLSESCTGWEASISDDLTELRKLRQHLETTEGAEADSVKSVDAIIGRLNRMCSRIERLRTDNKEKISHENDLKILGSLIAKRTERTEKLAKLMDYVKASVAEKHSLTLRSIIAMQFQDRNTQIMDNAVRLLRQYRELIGDVAHDSEYLDNVSSQLLQNFYSNIQMSDIRAIFIKALDGEHIPFPGSGNKPTNHQDDIEIF